MLFQFYPKALIRRAIRFPRRNGICRRCAIASNLIWISKFAWLHSTSRLISSADSQTCPRNQQLRQLRLDTHV